MHAPRIKPCTPPGATMHAPLEQPCMPPWSNHAHPPGATMHAPQSNHACPPGATTHAPLEQPRMPPGATMHAPPEQPGMPPQSNHTCPLPQSNHARPPPSNHACPPVKRMTNWCKNITLPKLRLRAVRRMHSSRMHTACLPTVSRGIPGPMSRDRWLPTPWTYLPDPGHTHPQKEADTRDTHSQKGHGTRDTPQTKQTDTCESITFPQLRLPAVKSVAIKRIIRTCYLLCSRSK